MNLADVATLPPTLGVTEVKKLWGVSDWAVRQGVKAGDLPVLPLRLGRLLRWPTAAVLRSIGLEPERATTRVVAGVVD